LHLLELIENMGKPLLSACACFAHDAPQARPYRALPESRRRSLIDASIGSWAVPSTSGKSDDG
jgi:hypothetical protein